MGEGNWINKPKEYSEFGLPIARRYRLSEGDVAITECEKEGADWKKLLEEQEKDFLEIGGPSLTYGEGEIINFNDYKDRTTCTNISNNFSIRNQDGEIVEAKEYIDRLADAAELPYEDESFGAVFARNFRIEESKRKLPKPKGLQSDFENNEYIRKVIKEARRVLTEGGLAVWLNLESADFKSLMDGGFEIIFYQKRDYANGRDRYQAVFRKDEKK